MKNKKGFTLMELLAVLVILSVVALVTIPMITNSLKSYKDNLYETQIGNIEKAAKIWGGDHIYSLPNDSESSVEFNYEDYLSNGAQFPDNYKRLTLKLKHLQNEGYIDKKLKNIRKVNDDGTTTDFDENLEIIIEKVGNKTEYTVIDQEFFAYFVGDTVKVKLNDSTSKEFVVIADSSNRYKTVKAIEKTSTEQIKWCNGCTSNSSGPVTINEKLDTLLWNNVKIKRLITRKEIENAIYIQRNENEANRNWIYGDYWTSTSFGTSKAYVAPTSYIIPAVVNNNSDIDLSNVNNTKQIDEAHTLRIVIEVDKKYVSKKD